jgi:hypothetical protein
MAEVPYPKNTLGKLFFAGRWFSLVTPFLSIIFCDNLRSFSYVVGGSFITYLISDGYVNYSIKKYGFTK